MIKNWVIDHTCHSSYRNAPSNYIVDVVVTAIHRATLGVFTDTETKLEINNITLLLVVTGDECTPNTIILMKCSKVILRSIANSTSYLHLTPSFGQEDAECYCKNLKIVIITLQERHLNHQLIDLAPEI